jgi:hypothetical protein
MITQLQRTEFVNFLNELSNCPFGPAEKDIISTRATIDDYIATFSPGISLREHKTSNGHRVVWITGIRPARKKYTVDIIIADFGNARGIIGP